MGFGLHIRPNLAMWKFLGDLCGKVDRTSPVRKESLLY